MNAVQQYTTNANHKHCVNVTTNESILIPVSYQAIIKWYFNKERTVAVKINQTYEYYNYNSTKECF